MPYDLILLIAAIGLAIRYAAIKSASDRSKCLVGGCALASLVIARLLPAWHLAASLLQLGVSFYVALYLVVISESG
jgi:hypothetical protein